ncbi:MAG TPA: YchF/TatD family DNA exonuclease [Gammaproteobacteria bacterium]|nr:YchF/TatD family DNA exonuclease [Gammaproteobacteria bacterium]
MLVDSHCHLDCIDLSEFNDNFDQLIQRSVEAGVEHMLCVSINLQKYPHMLEKVRPYKNISVSAGVHPMADRTEDYSVDVLGTLAEDSKVVAIGETGLDYFYHSDEKDWQQQQFRDHIQVARAHNKPVIVHTRDAAEDTLTILNEEKVSECAGVIHCFTEDRDFARRAMDMGMMISFSGILTFRNADRLREVAKYVPDDYLLIETDSPYLAPVPHRGRQNQPAYVNEVARTLAQLRNTGIEHIAEITRENFYRLFQLSVEETGSASPAGVSG